MTYEPFAIGSSFRVVPPGSSPVPDRTDIVMARGAFGSGEHETTASCIAIMEALDLAGKRFLDLGSGTAILAVTAMKRGAAGGVCVDIESGAVQSAILNCQLNSIGDEIRHLCGTLADVDEGGFDIILANIYGDILLALAKSVAERLAPGGTLLLSGILWEYNFDVRQAYERQGLRVMKNRLLEEFSTIVLAREKKGR